MIWVELAELQASEEELDGRGGIAIGRRPGYLDLQLVEIFSYVLAGVVPGAIEENDRVLPPAGPLNIQLQDQMPQEDKHHMLIGVGLCQGKVDTALRIQGGYQREPRRHRSLSH